MLVLAVSQSSLMLAAYLVAPDGVLPIRICTVNNVANRLVLRTEASPHCLEALLREKVYQ